jgi:cell division protein FtsN
MSVKVLSGAVLAAVFAAAPAFADLKGPAELPPPSYKGQQYVDSRGCVFLRAGYGGQVTWVPRVSRDRKQMCGYPPSGGTVAVAEDSPAPAPKVEVAAAAPAAPAAKPKVEVVVTPAPEVIRPVTATERAATAEVKGTTAAPGGVTGYRLACPVSTPVAERFEVRGGGTKVLCTKGDGTLDGATFPKLVEGSTDGYPKGYDAWVAAGVDPAAPARADGGTVYVTKGGTTAGGTAYAATKSAKYPDPTPPPGYKLAWEDDRLNPNRGKQTVQGVIDQDEIWTRTVPAELREDWPHEKKPLKIVVRNKDGSSSEYAGIVVSTKGDGKRVVRITGPYEGTTVVVAAAPVTAKAVSKSTKTDPKAAVVGSAKIYVQVGTFGVAANADRAAGTLKGLGLKVARGKAKGGALQVIYAGPFASAGEAKAALSAARGAGFGDAVIVQ